MATTTSLSYEDALCLVHTYQFADLAIFEKMFGKSKAKAKQKEAFKTLGEKGIDGENLSELNDAYDDLVEGTAEDILPEGWESTYDYWGGKCYAFKPGWNAPKSGTILAGENLRYMCCTNFEALKEELQKALTRNQDDL